jgi:hypothetical protein
VSVTDGLASLLLGLDNCDIDLFNFRHCQVQNYKSVQMKLKFCSQLLKAPQAKVNKVNQK